MSVNPYEAPESVESDLASTVPIAEMSKRTRHAVLSGLRTTRIGNVMVVLSIVCILIPWPSGITVSSQQAILQCIAFGGGFGVLVLLVGVAFLCTSEDGYRVLAWLALLLTTASLVVVSGYLAAYFSGQAVTGFYRLFGACAFASMSISLATVSLTMRSIAVRTADRPAKIKSALSVIAFATAAVIMSLVALNIGIDRRVDAFAVHLGFASIMIAMLTQVSAGTSLIQSVRQNSQRSVLE